MAVLVSALPPCVLHEDDHLLVVHKPAGVNTHAPAPYAGEGIYDWLRHREPRWADLAIIHRLDKETSGVLVFSKTELASRSLTQQFAQREVRKQYRLLTDRPVPASPLLAKSPISRRGDRYVAGGSGAAGQPAETRFRVVERGSTTTVVEAEPVTGRTHQIRVHAAWQGFPVLGDGLYGGSPHARVCLHACEVRFRHPATGQEVAFRAEPDFEADVRSALRGAFLDAQETNAFRLLHGAGDGWPGWYVDRLGEYLLSQGEPPLNEAQREKLQQWMRAFAARGVYHKRLERQVRHTTLPEASAQLVLGEPAPERFGVRENGLSFELSFAEGHSVGLFLDQRDNRRRLLTGQIAANFPLHSPPSPPAARTSPQGERRDAGLTCEAACSSLSCPDPLNPVGADVRRRPARFTQSLGLVTSAPTNAVGSCELLNVFAYTCGFSVGTALAGAHTTSLDLSKKYLDWGRRNFALNGLDPAEHDFLYGDALDWLRRLAKKGRVFDVVVLDPPTFSQSKEQGAFRAERDYGRLVGAALPLLEPNGVLFASTNAARLAPDVFLQQLRTAVTTAGRRIVQEHYVPQPPDFPMGREEPAYLKTVWLRVE